MVERNIDEQNKRIEDVKGVMLSHHWVYDEKKQTFLREEYEVHLRNVLYIELKYGLSAVEVFFEK